MATITEDYVSFETARLLKEKGFDAKCNKCYAYFADDDIRFLNLKYPKLAQLLIENRYPCITLQMAMKWLREVHNIFIEISVSIDLNGKYHYSYFILNRECKYIRKGYTYFDWNYEEAVEASIKYCLNNLI